MLHSFNHLIGFVHLFGLVLILLTFYAAKPAFAISLAIRALEPPSTWLEAHNVARAQYGAPPLKWNKELVALAQGWADNCLFEHSGAQGTGENLAAGTNSFSAFGAVNAWMKEKSAALRLSLSSFLSDQYHSDRYESNDPQPSHFTQVRLFPPSASLSLN